ncbi:MAG: serine/threonine-protein kinase, partial [Bdellovibrio sp.]
EVKIVDFGIAKAENQIEQTRAGTIKGKFSYMSPEQAEAQVVDMRTDIFSLGIILWELLTNERLFTSQSEAATLKKIRDCNIPSPRKLNPKVPVELEKIVMKALARDKGVRYQSSAALHKDLNRFLNTEYPDFSQQDFSVFMKSAYAEVFMENRKKLSQYAQTTSPLAMDPSTASFTESMSMDSLQLALENPLRPSDAKLEMKNLQLNQDVEARIRQKSIHIQNEVHSLSTRSGTSQPKKPRPQTTATPSSSSPLVSALAFITAAFAGWLIFFSDGVQFPKIQFPSGHLTGLSLNSSSNSSSEPGKALGNAPALTGAIEQPSRNQKVPVNIQSFPQDAQVQIDGQVVGRTPLSLELDSQRVFRLILTREGYLPYEQSAEKAQAPSTSIRATLVPEPPSGFVNIDVKGATSQTVIKINDIRLSEKLPLRRFRVPAGVPVRVQVMDPFSNLTTEQTITLGQGQARQLNFNLSKRPRANND